MQNTKQSRYWMRLVMVLVTVVMMVSGNIPAMAQEDPEARKFTDPSDPGYEHPIPNYDPWEGLSWSEDHQSHEGGSSPS